MSIAIDFSKVVVFLLREEGDRLIFSSRIYLDINIDNMITLRVG